tara:strand:- start:1989 stop:2822 length:834 start_codon:yes stop_codon:yes gene_type:complete
MTHSFIHNVRLDKNFTITCNRTPEDPNLSWGAKGLLWYILSRPPGWKVQTWQLSNIFTGKKRGNGKPAINEFINELKDAGYLVYLKFQDEKGQWNHSYDAYPMPFKDYQKMFPEPVKPVVVKEKIPEPVKPDTVKPASVKQPLLIRKELSRNEIIRKKKNIAQSRDSRGHEQRPELFYCHDSCEFKEITKKDRDDWKIAYPEIDISREIIKAEQWLQSTPTRANKKLWRKFITGWFTRSNEKQENKKAYRSQTTQTTDRRTKNTDGTPVSSPVDGLF